MRKSLQTILAVVALASMVTLSAGCMSSPAIRHPTPGGPRAGDTERFLVTAKKNVMSADYRADLEALARWREQVLPLADDPELGYLAHYWAGFASWRAAINGANRGMSDVELKAHLERAASDFEASVVQKPDFADGYAAASSVNGWLAPLYRTNAAVSQKYLARSREVLARARELAPDNPRVLWVLGSVYLFTPVGQGGSARRAIEIYRHMFEAADAAGPTSSALPDWGKPEALMSLANAHLNEPKPDLASAAEAAREALRLEPEWWYVRDVLMPQIETAVRLSRP